MDNEIRTIRVAFARITTVDQQALIADLFAAGCVLYRVGRSNAGWTACSTALKALGIMQEKHRDIVSKFKGDTQAMILAFRPHAELRLAMGPR